jgi:hypothetical protein
MNRPALTILVLACVCARGAGSPSQQPAEPTDVTPIDGETYYVINQLSGLQVDITNNSTAPEE